jgi:hypothetical protein
MHTGVDTGFRDIPHGSTLHHVPYGKPLDGFIFRRAPRAVGASDEFDMATAVLVATVIASLLSLKAFEKQSSALSLNFIRTPPLASSLSIRQTHEFVGCLLLNANVVVPI